MPKGPRGERRPADVIGAAVHVMRIATGEIRDNPLEPGKEYARKGGLIGGRKRAAKLSKKRRNEIAKKAATARWAKRPREAASKTTPPIR
jgi:hypothetical protein